MSSRLRKRSAIADLTRELSADRALALSYVPTRHRAAIEALFLIDAAMGDVVRTTSDPMLGQIRLAWWRERLEQLGADVAVPAEPRLRGVRRELIARGIMGSELARLERGWVAMFDAFPWDAGTAEAIWFRGRQLFAIGAELLDRTDDAIEGAGGLWVLIDAARHCSDAASRTLLLDQARTLARSLDGVRFPSALRPLSMLAALAVRDCRSGQPFEREGSAGRLFAALRHRWSGRLPTP